MGYDTSALPPRTSVACIPTGPAMYQLAVLFTGHMVDLAGRAEPRFPQAMTSLVDDVIKARLAALSESAEGSIVGLSSAARGGDLLFLDACRELGLDTRIVLPEPAAVFVAHSVSGVPESAWEEKFEELWNAHAPGEREVIKASPKGNIYDRCNKRLIALATALAQERRLIAFWNGKGGDGPGGTAAFAGLVERSGGVVERLAAERLLAAFQAAGA